MSPCSSHHLRFWESKHHTNWLTKALLNSSKPRLLSTLHRAGQSAQEANYGRIFLVLIKACCVEEIGITYPLISIPEISFGRVLAGEPKEENKRKQQQQQACTEQRR